MPTVEHVRLITETVDFIERNLTESISVSSVCEATSPLSSWQFQRVFRAVIGDSMGNYIRARRLTRALEMIRQQSDERRLLEIAFEFQFNSHEAFTRAFKSHFGIRPSEVRKLPTIPKSKLLPRFTEEKIQRISSGLVDAPEFKTLPASTFVGLRCEIQSPLGRNSSFDGTIPALWKEFLKRRSEVRDWIPGANAGLLLDTQDMDGDTMGYLASVQAEHVLDIPPGMITIEIPEQRYAVFRSIGKSESCHATPDYIYGIWLPRSGYARASGGVDYEVFGEDYRQGQPGAVSHYHLPVS